MRIAGERQREKEEKHDLSDVRTAAGLEPEASAKQTDLQDYGAHTNVGIAAG